MADHVGETAFEEAVEDVYRHAAPDLVLGHRRGIDEGATLDPMGDEAADVHLAEHGGDGGVGEIVAAGQGVVDFGHGGFAPGPENFQDLQLKISQSMDFGFAHGE